MGLRSELRTTDKLPRPLPPQRKIESKPPPPSSHSKLACPFLLFPLLALHLWIWTALLLGRSNCCSTVFKARGSEKPSLLTHLPVSFRHCHSFHRPLYDLCQGNNVRGSKPLRLERSEGAQGQELPILSPTIHLVLAWPPPGPVHQGEEPESARRHTQCGRDSENTMRRDQTPSKEVTRSTRHIHLGGDPDGCFEEEPNIRLRRVLGGKVPSIPKGRSGCRGDRQEGPPTGPGHHSIIGGRCQVGRWGGRGGGFEAGSQGGRLESTSVEAAARGQEAVPACLGHGKSIGACPARDHRLVESYQVGFVAVIFVPV